jgi:hypothetical protein
MVAGESSILLPAVRHRSCQPLSPHLCSDGFFERAPQPSVPFHSAHQGRASEKALALFGNKTASLARASSSRDPVSRNHRASICMDRATSYGVGLRVTTSATPSTSAYVAKRNAPYLPPDVACSFGMKVDKLESTTASPIIPGIASRSIADVQFAVAMCRHRRIAMQRTAETIGDRVKAVQ